jgi:plastocyanin
VKRLLALGTIVLIVLALSGVALAATKTVKATSTDKWGPTHLFVGKGTPVVWKNPTSKVHNIKSTSKNWDYKRILDPGESAKRTFKAKGYYKYRCLLHSSLVSGVCRGMCGFVHVS